MVKAGLEDVVAAKSAICFIDGQEGRLFYQGYNIHDLAQHSTFEEVVYLLWFGKLPNKEELANLSADLASNRRLPPDFVEMMKRWPAGALPMEALRTAVSALSMYDPDGQDNSRTANIAKATRLTAKIPTIIAYWDNIRKGRQPLPPKTDVNLACNFLYLLNQEMPSDTAARCLDIALILHAEHGFNASTFAGRVTAGTLSDIYSAVVAAIATLKGPLHGGANQEVIKMLVEIGSPDKAVRHIQHLLEEDHKVMGFGHRVYRTEDPRATHLRKMSEELGRQNNEPHWFEISRRIEEFMRQEKGLNCNVDFYSASVYHMLGIPGDLFTPIFACSRISGWAAHLLEQYADNKLIRPQAEYTGSLNLTYLPIWQR